MVKDRIEESYIQEDTIREMNRLLPDETTLRHISGFFSIFADSTRVKIISALAMREMCVGDLAMLLDMRQSTLSHQLKVLKGYGVVDYRREGKMIFYFVSNVLVEDVMGLGIENIKNMMSMY